MADEKIQKLLKGGEISIAKIAKKASINRTALSQFVNGHGNMPKHSEKIERLKAELAIIGEQCIDASK